MTDPVVRLTVLAEKIRSMEVAVSDIIIRKARFEFPETLEDVFPGDDPPGEAMLAALSLTLPYLEPYLIRVYRKVVDQITDPDLRSDVDGFIGQEAQHHRNHRRANDAIKAVVGPLVSRELETIEDQLEADYRRFTDNKSLRFNLVYAEGFEAMTCAWAVNMFAEAAAGRGPQRNGPWQQLWAWHAAEEIEHRTVAFRVYEDLVGSYPYRVAGAARSQFHFLRYIARFEKALAQVQGIRYRPHVPGAIRNNLGSFARTYLPGYDPANIDPGPLPDLVLVNTPLAD